VNRTTVAVPEDVACDEEYATLEFVGNVSTPLVFLAARSFKKMICFQPILKIKKKIVKKIGFWFINGTNLFAIKIDVVYFERSSSCRHSSSSLLLRCSLLPL